MRSIKMLLINLALLGGIGFCTLQAHKTWNQREFSKPSAVRASESISDKTDVGVRILKRGRMPLSSYAVVANRNLFSPDRNLPQPEDTATPPVVKEVKSLKISGKKIDLYGVVMIGDEQKALITNPESGPGLKKHRWVEAGETVGTVSVVSIAPDRIRLSEAAGQYDVLLYDSRKPGRSEIAGKSETPTIVSSQEPKIDTESKPEKKARVEPEAGEYEIVNTPFGKLKRRKKK